MILLPIMSPMGMNAKTLLGIAACALALALPASQAIAGKSSRSRSVASKACKAELKRKGHKAFVKKYGKPALRNCSSKTTPAAAEAVASATNECDDELAEYGLAEFLDDYESPNFSEAYDYCVVEGAMEELDLLGGDDDGTDDGSDE